MTSEQDVRIKLYSYWRSSASYRVRIALNLKGLAYETIPVNLIGQGGEHLHREYREINPQALVPVLDDGGQRITQSMAICEYLEERYGGYPLLPSDALERARVRSLALQVACEIHPLNNLRVQLFLKDQCADRIDTVEWMHHWMNEGFTALEAQLSGMSAGDGAGPGGRPGLFECFLIPQVYNAERYDLDMTVFPLIGSIVTKCRRQDAFIRAAPENQPDAVAV